MRPAPAAPVPALVPSDDADLSDDASDGSGDAALRAPPSEDVQSMCPADLSAGPENNEIHQDEDSDEQKKADGEAGNEGHRNAIGLEEFRAALARSASLVDSPEWKRWG